jgi:hypothetical protein
MNETRTYEISGSPEQLDIIERILGRITYMCNVGMSRSINVFVDGDGAVRIKATRNGEKLAHGDIEYEKSGAYIKTLPSGDVKADLG